MKCELDEAQMKLVLLNNQIQGLTFKTDWYICQVYSFVKLAREKKFETEANRDFFFNILNRLKREREKGEGDNNTIQVFFKRGNIGISQHVETRIIS